MTVEGKLKKLKKWELIGLARKLKATGYHKFNKKELFDYLTTNYSEPEIKAILDLKVTPLMRVKDFTHVYGVQTTLGLLVGIIAIILAITFQQSSQKIDIARYELLERMNKKLEQFDPIKRDQIIKHLEKVNEELKTALEGNSKEENEALEALKKGSPNKVRELLKKRISNNKDTERPEENYFNLGNAFYLELKIEKALESYNKAIEIKPDFYNAWCNKGVTLYALNRYEDAINAYNKAIEIKPDKHEAWYSQGNSFAALGRHKDAIQAYDKAIEIKPDKHEAWYNKGITLDALGRHDEALEAYIKAIEIKPDSPEAWYKKGVTLYDLGRYDEALEAINKAIEIKSDSPEAWYNKGTALAALGRHDEALEAYIKAKEINPDFPKTKYNIVIVKVVEFFRLYRDDKAFEAYNFVYQEKMDKSTSVLRIGIDGSWSVYEMIQMLKALEDLYNFTLVIAIVGEEFPPLTEFVKEALKIGKLRINEEKFSEFFRTVTKSIEGAELTIKSIEYSSPGPLNIRGNGKGIKVIFDFLKWFIEYFSPTSFKKRKFELEEKKSKINSDKRIRELKIKDKESKMIWEFFEHAKAYGYPEHELKAIIPYIYEKTNPLKEFVVREKLVSVNQESDKVKEE